MTEKTPVTVAMAGRCHIQQWDDGAVRIVDADDDFVFIGVDADGLGPLILALQQAQANLAADVSPAPPAAQEDR